MSNIGLHLRVTSTLPEVFERAARLQLPFFQAFALYQRNNKYIECTQEVMEHCTLLSDNFVYRYLHGSYYVNLASAYPQQVLKKELTLAKQLAFTHIVFHPGAITDGSEKLVGIERVARTLNAVLKHESSIKVVLENSAHATKAIGGSLYELGLIKERLDHPEKVQFCIDTAHAYVFGYNVSEEREQADFIEEVKNLCGVQGLALLHINDTQELLGSRIDRHCIPGKGNIGKKALQHFLSHAFCKDVPVVLELPELSETEEQEILNQVRAWIKKEIV